MKRKVGRPPKLSSKQIIDAALADGVATFTMSSVARRLEVSHSGLYRYFEDHAALLRAAIDTTISEQSWPSTHDRPWRTALVEIAGTIWHMCDEVPGIDRAMLASTGSTPTAERLARDWAEGLTDQGFTAEEAGIAIDFIVMLAVTSSSLMDRLESVMVQRTSTSTTDPVLRRIAHDHSQRDHGWFDVKVEIFLDGLAQRLGG